MNEINRVLFVDMDGVIADFNGHFKSISGISTNQVSEKELWNQIQAYGTEKFFSELPWSIGGKDLWMFVNRNFSDVRILSSLGGIYNLNGSVSKGKMNWLQKNIPSPSIQKILFVPNSTDKKNFCKTGDILIDDNIDNINEWKRVGGIGILHKSSRDTIFQLMSLIKDETKNEGYGMLDMFKDKKRAFDGARWTVKFNENINKTKITKKSLKNLIKEILLEMYNNEILSDDYNKSIMERKDMNPKEKIRNIIRESVKEAIEENKKMNIHEYDETQEVLLIKQIQSIASWLVNQDKYMKLPTKNDWKSVENWINSSKKAAKEIKSIADELVLMHKLNVDEVAPEG